MAACGKKETASEHPGRTSRSNIDWPVYVDPGVASKDADMMAAVNMYDSLTFPLTMTNYKPAGSRELGI